MIENKTKVKTCNICHKAFTPGDYNHHILMYVHDSGVTEVENAYHIRMYQKLSKKMTEGLADTIFEYVF